MSSLTTNSSTVSCLTCSELASQVRIQNYSDNYNLPAIELLHQECPVCDEFDVDESQLCHLCAHIRPAHLLTCSIVHDILKEDENIEIKLGTLAELKVRQNRCVFCRWCLHVVQADSQMRQYTVDEKEQLGLDREGWRQVIHHDAGIIDYSESYQSIPYLCFKTRTSRIGSFRKWKTIKLGHNKRLSRVASASGNRFATKLGLPKVKDFSAQSPLVDWDKIRRWKAVCEKEHSICSARVPRKQLPSNFRLIDVESTSVIEVNFRPISFFALSYVWGANPGDSRAELRRDNLADLKERGSLRGLPRTIAHAVDVCRTLNQPYLWVDRLCIVQDDKVDKYGQIQSMEAIYSRADLVIVAACGDSMQSGLPGVHSEFPREQYQVSTNIFGFTMANRFHHFEEAMKSAWDERGWTYQEAVLAKRKLYFTEAELWFECSESLERENVFSSIVDAPNHLGNHLKARGLSEFGPYMDDYDQYRQHLEQYSRRILTYPSDVYDAFRGIQDSFYAESDVLFGLPESDFHRALTWFPNDLPGLQERQCKDRDMTLPSWSWASLIGRVTTDGICGSDNFRSLYYGSFYCSLCIWATWTIGITPGRVRRISSKNDQMVWAQLDNLWSNKATRQEPQDKFHGEPDYRQFLALAWIKGCIEADVPADLLGQETETSMSPKSLACRWPTVQDFWNEAQNSICHKDNLYDSPYLHAGHIATRTQCVTLRVKQDKYGPTFYIFKTQVRGGERIGSLLSENEYQLRGADSSDGAADVDFIALAVGSMPWGAARLTDTDVLVKNRFHAGQPEPWSEFGQPGIIVMAVRWEGPVGRRVALGWVALQGWVDSKPDFRTVILS